MLPVPDIGDMASGQILDSGVILSNGVNHHSEWQNDTGVDLRVRMVLIWVGADLDSQMDIGTYVRRKSDGSPLAIQPYDRYANPSLPGGQLFPLTPGMVIKNGDSITLDCSSLDGVHTPPQWHTQHDVTVWVERA